MYYLHRAWDFVVLLSADTWGIPALIFFLSCLGLIFFGLVMGCVLNPRFDPYFKESLWMTELSNSPAWGIRGLTYASWVAKKEWFGGGRTNVLQFNFRAHLGAPIYWLCVGWTALVIIWTAITAVLGIVAIGH
jgi:hypothetical protein